MMDLTPGGAILSLNTVPAHAALEPNGKIWDWTKQTCYEDPYDATMTAVADLAASPQTICDQTRAEDPTTTEMKNLYFEVLRPLDMNPANYKVACACHLVTESVSAAVGTIA